tara:strand:- start:433 stop:807 length:375 start_codon:yes stop_codon:yes gene_type:complete
MENLEDILEFVKNEDGDVQIKMTKGRYSDLVIRYGDVMFFPGEESNDNIKFSYEIIENPNNVEEDEEFYDFFGALVLDIAENYLSPITSNIDLSEYNLQGTEEDLINQIEELKKGMELERADNG